MTDEEQLYTAKNLVSLTGFSMSSVRRLIRKSGLRPVDIDGGVYYYNKDVLDKLEWYKLSRYYWKSSPIPESETSWTSKTSATPETLEIIKEYGERITQLEINIKTLESDMYKISDR